MRVAIRVKPGASRTLVAGRRPSPNGDELVVSVSARAVDGQANAAVVAALSKALRIPKRDIVIVLGATARSKVVELPDSAADDIARLLAS